MNIASFFKNALKNPSGTNKKILLRLKNSYKYLHGYLSFVSKQSPWVDLDVSNLQSTLFFDLKTTKNAPFSTVKKNDFFNQEHQDPFKNQFSFSIIPPLFSDANPEKYGFDIKILWENSRFSELLIAGEKFQKNPNEYSTERDLFMKIITSWEEENPYLSGSCWMNAMEVGIRAINLLWLFHFFYTPPHNDSQRCFWKKYCDLLFAHATFINNYWEEYDHQNNHYLINLTAAWYLALFFAEFNNYPLGSLENLWQKVCTGFENQLNNDGTLNEGSTSYHKLIMQCLLHITKLNQKNTFSFSEKLAARIDRGMQFLADCTNTPDSIVQIGDNDSNYLLSPIQLTLLSDIHDQQKMTHEIYTKEYSDFGIVFLINQHWHISLRTKSFSGSENRGHFHQDLLGITATYNAQQIITDPGTGWYTSNTTTRNLLRSKESHSTFFPQKSFAHTFESLFSISGEPIPSRPVLINKSATTVTATAQYEFAGLVCTRSIKLDGLKDTLTITDTTLNKNTNLDETFESNLILSPECTVTEIDPRFFSITSNHTSLLLETSATSLFSGESWYSKEYGHLVRCPKLLWLQKNTSQTTTRLYPK